MYGNSLLGSVFETGNYAPSKVGESIGFVELEINERMGGQKTKQSKVNCCFCLKILHCRLYSYTRILYLQLSRGTWNYRHGFRTQSFEALFRMFEAESYLTMTLPGHLVSPGLCDWSSPSTFLYSCASCCVQQLIPCALQAGLEHRVTHPGA